MSLRSVVQRLAPLLLTRQWLTYLSQALIEASPRQQLLDELTARGVPAQLAEIILQSLEADPRIEAARAQRRQLGRLRQVLRLRQTLEARRSDIERIPSPDPDTFLRRYVAGNEPVLLTDAAADWPALQRWQLGPLRQRFGTVEIEACLGRSRFETPDPRWEKQTHRMPLADYLDLVESCRGESNDLYMIAHNRNIQRPALAALFEDIRLRDGYFSDQDPATASSLWIGPQGTHTPLHHDGCNVLFHQIVGRKRIRLISPLQAELLETIHEGYYSDRQAPDWEAEGLHITEVIVEPGQALLIPAGWWHEVEALSISVSFSLLHLEGGNDYGWYAPGKI